MKKILELDLLMFDGDTKDTKDAGDAGDAGANEDKGTSDGDVKTVPYKKFSSVIAEKNTLKNEVSTLKEQLAGWVTKSEGLIDKEEMKTFKADLELKSQKNMNDLVIKNKITTKLVSEGLEVGLAEMVHRELKATGIMDGLKMMENGKVMGMDDIVKSVKENTGFARLFGEKAPVTGTGKTTLPQGAGSIKKDGILTREEVGALDNDARLLYKSKNKDWWKA